jgi:predicted DCC family thiol-disulfide oxidoreductase YuxK
MAHSDDPSVRRIVLFDGVCSVCDRIVNFILDHDSRGRFQFAPLQSPAGRALAEKYGVGTSLETMVLIEGDRAFTRSTAALRMARQLDGAWPLAYALILVPTSLRDWAYRGFAARRYRWFGQLDACRIPTPETRSRFLDFAEPSAPAN